MTTVLLDTNVLIELEDAGRGLAESNARMLREASHNVDFYIHPHQYRDIARDKNEDRRILLLSRIARYRVLDEPPCFTDSYFESKGWINKTDNDRIDNTLLACVVEPVVDYLLTRDKRIISNAVRAGVGDRVLNPDEFGRLVSKDVDLPEFAYVRDEPCHALRLEDQFFDSLRTSYGADTFNAWLMRCARSQRKCWTVRKESKLLALCIYKHEESGILDDTGFKPDGKVLKLCTFKVDKELQGSKVGERLLHKAFVYAQAMDTDFMYLTLRESGNEHLVTLLSEFGFSRYGLNELGDRVVGKYLHAQTPDDFSLEKAEFVKRFYPSFREDETVNKFMIPIGREYHEQLFPDISDFKGTLLGNMPEMYGPESNTIRKAYLSGRPNKLMKAGDLLLFYRSEDRHSIEVLGVVKEAVRLKDRNSIFDLVKRRTVYSLWEIDQWVSNYPDGVFVICFDVIRYFETPVGLDLLWSIGLTYPQSIVRIADDGKYRAIMEAGR